MVVPGKGTLLQVEIASIFTTIAQRVAITPPTIAVGEKDDTTLDDTIRKKSGTITDVGEVSLKIQYDEASTTHDALMDYAVDITHPDKNWKIIYNDHVTQASRTTDAFSGWVKTVAPGELTVDNNREADVTIVLTSLPVRTPRGV